MRLDSKKHLEDVRRAGRCCGRQLAQGQAVMANDYIPRPAAQFDAWQSNFVTYVNGHPADLGLAAGNPARAN